MNPYIGDRPLDPPESDYECRGCGMQFNGWGSLSHHASRCVKALLLVADEDDERETCEYCEGNGSTNPTWSDPCGDQCPECLGSGFAITPDMTDPGEPNDYPED